MDGVESLRVRGVTLRDVSDYLDPATARRTSPFFGALARHVNLTGISRPVLSRPARYAHLARSFIPDRARWRARVNFSLANTSKLSANLARDLAARRDEYDLIVQVQTMCSPRSPAVDAPYVIYTDNTMAMTQRHYPRWAPLSPARSEAWQRFEAGVCQGAEVVFTNSEFARRSVVQDYGCQPEQVVPIGTGANYLLDRPQVRRRRARQALFVGYEFERKGGYDLLDAWRLVHERIPDAELIIVGPARDPAPGFGRGVAWRGQADVAELTRLYGTAQVFVLPSIFEPWGQVFVEAMGCGLPCIGRDSCAMPELIEDGVTGRLVPPGEVEPLADALTELLTDPDKAGEMGRAGHARVLAELQWDHVVERLVNRLSPAAAT